MKNVLLSLLLLTPLSLTAQTPAPADSARSVIPGPQFKKGGFHRWLFGSHYRDYWLKPLVVEDLDLSSVGGGLTPTQRGGGKQTRSLRFRAADGSEYAVRSLEKDPSPLLPPELRGTAIDRVTEDQMSAGQPVGPLVASPLLHAAGVLHATPRLVRIPDDPRLGEFRQDFAGMIGFLEQRPTDDTPVLGRPDLKGDVASSDKLIKRLEEHPEETLDTRAYLAARLMDTYLGDWDRHADQWRWLKPDRSRSWLPIPRDRDQAFARFDGLLLDLARLSAPQLVEFGPKYPSTVGISWNARFLDRRFLPALSWPVWDSTAQALTAQLTDSVIAVAAEQLPESYGEQERATLAATLRRRRDDLPAEARKLYEFLAHEVDVYATDASERVSLRRAQDTLDLSIAQGDRPPRFQRRFLGNETQEVRLYLQGGADAVQIEGKGSGPMLHIVPGGGNDAVRAARGVGRVLVSSDRGEDVLEGAKADRRPFNPARFGDSLGVHRDWGSFPRALTWFSYGKDLGLFLGGGLAYYDFGFRKYPYASRIGVRAGWAFGAQTGRVEFRANLPQRNSRTELGFFARYSGLEVVTFHGYGNESDDSQDESFYRVKQEQVRIAPFVTFGAHTSLAFTVGPVLEYLETQLPTDKLIGQLRPYGTDPFGQVGAQIGLVYDTRDDDNWPTRGLRIATRGELWPKLWDVVETYGVLNAQVSTYLTPIRRGPTLALRAGGKRVWGQFPLHEAAIAGSAETVRGLHEGRYAGDAAVWANSELRLYLTDFFVILPGQFGLVGAADAGRVFLEGENSDTWHTGVGGGFWISLIERHNTLSALLMTSEGEKGFYLKAGFVF